MCECVTEVEALLKAKHEDAELDMVVLFSKGYSVPSIRYQYHHILKSGKKAQRKTSYLLIPTYCPFCGVKYEE